jgi:hypothetical protein
MNQSDFARRFDVKTYNTLISVEEADKIVRANDELDNFLEASSKVFRSYNLQSRFGVSLLHKHTPCKHNERMIETSECIADRDALVTRPILQNADHEDANPISWRICNAKFYPLEFSRDPLACRLLLDGEIPSSFLDDFRELANRSQIGQFVGLAVVRRGLYDSANQDEIAVEYYDEADRSNVVVLRNRHGLDGKTIETVWSFEESVDPAKDCLKRCKKTCWSTPDGHRPNHEHLHL